MCDLVLNVTKPCGITQITKISVWEYCECPCYLYDHIYDKKLRIKDTRDKCSISLNVQSERGPAY